MKTSFFVKAAVVAMAAFGAFAFNGNTQEDLKPFKIKEGTVCTDIRAECSEKLNGSVCKIQKEGGLETVYDLDCVTEVLHNDSEPVNWEPIMQ